MTINDPNGPNRAWGTLSLAIRLAQMVGPLILVSYPTLILYRSKAGLRKSLRPLHPSIVTLILCRP
jgi:hypothetical protein